MQITPIPVTEDDIKPKSPDKKNDVKEWPKISPLSRSKSMESLPRHRPTGTTALRALFESKFTNQPEFKSSKTTLESVVVNERAKNSTLTSRPTRPVDKDAEDTKTQAEAEVYNNHDKQETEEFQVIMKVNSFDLTER